MNIDALQFVAGLPFEGPIQSKLSESILTDKASQKLPAAYVVRSQDLESLRKSEELKALITDRGEKNQATPLSKYLLKQDKIPLIDGRFRDSGKKLKYGFTDSGQLERSVRTLLANAWAREDRNLYIIGVDEERFEDLRVDLGRDRAQAGAAYTAADSVESDF